MWATTLCRLVGGKASGVVGGCWGCAGGQRVAGICGGARVSPALPAGEVFRRRVGTAPRSGDSSRSQRFMQQRSPVPERGAA
jgi:hypothetical protein